SPAAAVVSQMPFAPVSTTTAFWRPVPGAMRWTSASAESATPSRTTSTRVRMRENNVRRARVQTRRDGGCHALPRVRRRGRGYLDDRAGTERPCDMAGVTACPECGVGNAADHNYCKHCGLALRVGPSDRELTVSPAEGMRNRYLALVEAYPDNATAHFN